MKPQKQSLNIYKEIQRPAEMKGTKDEGRGLALAIPNSALVKSIRSKPGGILQWGFGNLGPPDTPKSQLWQFLQSSWIKHGREGLEVIAEGGSSPGPATPRNHMELNTGKAFTALSHPGSWAETELRTLQPSTQAVSDWDFVFSSPIPHPPQGREGLLRAAPAASRDGEGTAG